MQLSANETGMTGVSFNQVEDTEGKAIFAHPPPTSKGLLPYTSLSLLSNNNAEFYFTTAPLDQSAWIHSQEAARDLGPFESFYYPCAVLPVGQTQYNDDRPSWTFPEELASELRTPQSVQLPLDVSSTSQPLYSNILSSPKGSNISANSMITSKCQVDLFNITKYETSNLPAGSKDNINKQESAYQSSTSPSQCEHPLQPPACARQIPRRSSFDTVPDQCRVKPNVRSRPSSLSETQASVKKRRNYSGVPESVSPPETSIPDLEVEFMATEPSATPTSKPSAKGSHSLIERRYRENLNAKITQLDQTLTEIRDRSRKCGYFENDEKCAETKGKTRKADVLNDAMRYVKQAELDSEERKKEIDFLRLRVAALEKLVHCGDCALLKQFTTQKTGDKSTNF